MSGQGPAVVEAVLRAGRAVREDDRLVKALVARLGGDVRANLRRAYADALTSASTPAAQRGLVDVIRGTESPNLARELVQRLMLVPSPTAETVAFVRERLAVATDRDDLESAGYTLGGLAHRLGESGGLVEDLRALLARDPEIGLVAIGNAGLPALFEESVAFLRQPDARLRAAACLSIRRIARPEVNRLLLFALFDGQFVVGSSALTALHGRALHAEEQALLSRLFEHAPFAAVLVPGLVQWLEGQAALSVALVPALEALERLGSSDPATRASLQALRRRLT